MLNLNNQNLLQLNIISKLFEDSFFKKSFLSEAFYMLLCSKNFTPILLRWYVVFSFLFFVFSFCFLFFFRWPLFLYLHQQFTVLIIIFVFWTQLSSSIVHELVVVNHSKIYLWLNLDTPKILTCFVVVKVVNKYGELNI